MITLASDFGSPYPAAMRGVVHDNTDEATVVDITHDLPRQDIRSAAFWLREVLPWFPPAVHCAVVDPGVGTDRDALVVRCGDHALVGPDNGLLAPVATALGEATWYRLSDPEPTSATFHGRDIFAPTAARVHEAGLGSLPDLDGIEPAPDPVELDFPEPVITGDTVKGTVLVIDGFGNVITNIPGELARDHLDEELRVNGSVVPVRHSYNAVDPGERVLTVGSHGNVELAVNQGRGDEAFGLGLDDPVRLS